MQHVSRANNANKTLVGKSKGKRSVGRSMHFFGTVMLKSALGKRDLMLWTGPDIGHGPVAGMGPQKVSHVPVPNTIDIMVIRLLEMKQRKLENGPAFLR